MTLMTLQEMGFIFRYMEGRDLAVVVDIDFRSRRADEYRWDRNDYLARLVRDDTQARVVVEIVSGEPRVVGAVVYRFLKTHIEVNRMILDPDLPDRKSLEFGFIDTMRVMALKAKRGLEFNVLQAPSRPVKADELPLWTDDFDWHHIADSPAFIFERPDRKQEDQ